MRKLIYIVFVGIVITMACGACEKEDPLLENGITRGVAVNDSIENDSTSIGGISIKIDTTWIDTLYYHF